MANTSLRSRLRRLFSTNVIVRRIGKKRLQVVDSNKLQSLGNMKQTKYIDRFSGIHQRNPGYSTYNNTANYHQNRVELYTDYEGMDLDPIIASALDIYADESTVKDADGDTLTISSPDDNIRKILRNLFYDVLNIDYNLWPWIRNACKYGDFFLHLDIEDDIGIVNVTPLSSYEVRREEGYDEEGRFVSVEGDDDFEIITREDDDEPEVVVVEPAPVNVSLQGLEEPINRLSSSVDLAASEFGVAASRFETAADAFESASGNFVTSSRYFKEASDEFAKIPDAIKDGLQQLGERLIDKLGELDKNLVDGDIEDADDEDIKKGSEIIEKGLGGSEVKEIVKYTDFLANKFSKFFPATRYNYTKLGTMKDKIVGGDLDFTTLVTTEVSKGKALNWWRLSIAKAITQIPKLEKLDRHIDFIDKTYDGLKGPISMASKFFRR